MKEKLQRVLVRECLIRHYGTGGYTLDECVEELIKIWNGDYEEMFSNQDETKELEEYDLSPRILTGFKRKRLNTVADLKRFLLFCPKFRDMGVIGISGLGATATQEIMEKIPELQELIKE